MKVYSGSKVYPFSPCGRTGCKTYVTAMVMKDRLVWCLPYTPSLSCAQGLPPEFDFGQAESLLSCFVDSHRYLESLRSNACLRMDLSP